MTVRGLVPGVPAVRSASVIEAQYDYGGNEQRFFGRAHGHGILF